MDAASNNSVDDIRELRDSRRVRARVGQAQGVHPRRGPHALDGRLERVPEDARGAAAEDGVRARHDRGQQGARDGRRSLPPLRLPAPHGRADRRRSCAARPQPESIEIPPEAIAALARSATGSFRDALGTLEQLLAYSGGRRSRWRTCSRCSASPTRRLLEQTVDAVAAGDARGALLALAECADSGRDASSFARDLESRARELLVVQTLGEVPSELALTPEADARLAAQAERVPHATVVRLLELIGSAMESVRAGADARTRLELALVKAAQARGRRLDPGAAGPHRALGGRRDVRRRRCRPLERGAPAHPATADPAPASPAPEAPAVSDAEPASDGRQRQPNDPARLGRPSKRPAPAPLRQPAPAAARRPRRARGDRADTRARGCRSHPSPRCP